jgi:hypothetical protein
VAGGRVTRLASRVVLTRPTLYTMLRRMRDETGGPSVRIRLVALLAAVGLLVVSAPAVLPLVRWIADLVW